MKPESIRVAFFPDTYYEIDGVAVITRQFEAFAKRRGLPLLMVYGGPRTEVTNDGSVTKIQLNRGPVSFSVDRNHDYDLLFMRHYRRVEALVREFEPDVLQITGPSDVGALGALVAHQLHIPLAAFWLTNLHQYARSRASLLVSGLPQSWAVPLLDAVERWSLRAVTRFYHIPQFLLAPNPELVHLVEKGTGKHCSLMHHGVDTDIFSPAFRGMKSPGADFQSSKSESQSSDSRPILGQSIFDQAGPLRIGYVGRLTTEKNVRLLAQLEQTLLILGHRGLRFLIVGQGAEEGWLRENMPQAEFTGVLTGNDLSRAFASMDVLLFPSHTDTFGLAVLEALASGVPVVVSSGGGPKYTVRHGETGYIANNFDEFVTYTAALLTQPSLRASMSAAARQFALSNSWDHVFEEVYNSYQDSLLAAV